MESKTIRLVPMVLLMASLGMNNAAAENVFFDLITLEGVNMARLELRNGSGNHNEFVGLTFTEAGQNFGLSRSLHRHHGSHGKYRHVRRVLSTRIRRVDR